MKAFRRVARRLGITDEALRLVADCVSGGWGDVDLGHGIYKHRVARCGEGKSGGFRVVVVFKRHGSLFFGGAFAKSEKSNLTRAELAGMRNVADLLLSLSEAQLGMWVEQGRLEKIDGD